MTVMHSNDKIISIEVGGTLMCVPGTVPIIRNIKIAMNTPVAWRIQTASAAKLSPITYLMFV
jgi:hypothetical protein